MSRVALVIFPICVEMVRSHVLSTGSLKNNDFLEYFFLWVFQYHWPARESFLSKVATRISHPPCYPFFNSKFIESHKLRRGRWGSSGQSTNMNRASSTKQYWKLMHRDVFLKKIVLQILLIVIYIIFCFNNFEKTCIFELVRAKMCFCINCLMWKLVTF
jgi:hypothetical protein